MAPATLFVFWFQPILRVAGAATVPRVSVELLLSTRLPLALAVKPLVAPVTRPMERSPEMSAVKVGLVTVKSRSALAVPPPASL